MYTDRQTNGCERAQLFRGRTVRRSYRLAQEAARPRKAAIRVTLIALRILTQSHLCARDSRAPFQGTGDELLPGQAQFNPMEKPVR